MTTMDDVIRALTARGHEERHRQFSPLKAPAYRPTAQHIDKGVNVGLAVASMKDHMTDEGWQLFLGLHLAGYFLEGGKVPGSERSNVAEIVRHHEPVKTVVVQDKREWEGRTADRAGFDPVERFTHAGFLSSLPATFRLTVLKDAHQEPAYHRDSAEEIGTHAWVTYYHPTLVSFVAPYVRRRHLVRTYHSLDNLLVPEYRPDGRSGAVLSGAISTAYPLRERIVRSLRAFPSVDHVKHPGYRRDGCHTTRYLQTLSHYKVAICTASIYGYALRKIVEATAAGCVVVTDLPVEDRMPVIDGNLVRVSNNIGIAALNGLIEKLLREYDSDRQRTYSEAAREWYDYRAVGRKLASDIEDLRSTYL